MRVTLWQDVRALSFTFSDGTTPKETVTLNYGDTVGVRVGASYRFWRDADDEPRLTARIGGGWEQGPTSPAATSPLLPDGDRALVGGGFGLRFGVVAVDAGYLAAIAPRVPRRLSGSFVARYRSRHPHRLPRAHLPLAEFSVEIGRAGLQALIEARTVAVITFYSRRA